ncbi:hypothetical protein [Methanoculleus chikugoensis]|uniref:hypothetical protein n=1 Tax=Methanoculleus chikugoensis TaxID=118126 RepID=UPI001FB29421|nr:hypothetical protein [Methanoculleus chikugoensis]
MLVDLVGNALASMDGAIFDGLDACPSCGGQVIGHDMRAKRFAVMHDNGKEHTVRVFVKRFYCRDCGALCYADAPFYPPDTRLASPIVDLCLLLSQQMPFNQVAQHLRAMGGIVVDRGGTIRNYASRDFGTIPATNLFGFLLPLSLLNLATFTLDRERRPIVGGAEALAACGFPPAGRTSLRGRGGTPEERNQRNEQEEKEERES